ncbi:DUF952 domain-containing protein [Aphanothece sacrum]|uniref:Glutathione S-transferase n=1 Tax=Aphanothece sacrum FPU1 TaxID=1920663 RepID=A0A401IDZ7_APHSA|nr:DUF952 domain-containing protein [Aphanothece sacrum]GBF79495.1 glutathione S-transferase [Aphanothece sacrum FPU1]GBF83964.1 glutathione S-transferase [Aphanothece sacrum FPU3]
MLIFHITTSESWKIAQNMSEYKTESLDIEGFIHASTITQVIKVANAFYHSYNSLIVLSINPDKLLTDVRWESPIHRDTQGSLIVNSEETFPHIYGVINLDAVVEILPLIKNNQGVWEYES